jgi:hypothetical protein
MKAFILAGYVACIGLGITCEAKAIGPGDQTHTGVGYRGFANPLNNPGAPLTRIPSAPGGTLSAAASKPAGVPPVTPVKGVLGTPANATAKSKWPR